MKVNRLVLDLSHHNTIEDLVDVRNAGIVGVIHKATEGHTYIDEDYRSRRAEADEVGLLWGAYHFLRPGDMIAQAEHFLELVGDNGHVLLAADHEDRGVSLSDLIDFLDAVEHRTGQRPIIYSGDVLKDQLAAEPSERISHNRLWLAQYGSSPSWPEQWEAPWLWQFTDGEDGPEPHTCPGIAGPVDGNSFDGTPSELIEQWLDLADELEPAPEPPMHQVVITISVPAGTPIKVVTL